MGVRGIFALSVLLAAGATLAAATLGPPPAASNSSAARVLSRRKRYVAFPEGSSVSGALCLTIGVIGNPHTDYLSYALNWGVAYDLPNETWARQHAAGFKDDRKNAKPVVQRRTRRDLYEKIETAINDMGFNGHDCIARALCESAKYLRGGGGRRGSMIEEIVKTIFSLPRQRVLEHEPEAVHRYDRVYRRAAREVRDCGAEYAGCGFSLLELALGRYSVEPQRQATAGFAGRGPPFAFM